MEQRPRDQPTKPKIFTICSLLRRLRSFPWNHLKGDRWCRGKDLQEGKQPGICVSKRGCILRTWVVRQSAGSSIGLLPTSQSGESGLRMAPAPTVRTGASTETKRPDPPRYLTELTNQTWRQYGNGAGCTSGDTETRQASKARPVTSQSGTRTRHRNSPAGTPRCTGPPGRSP